MKASTKEKKYVPGFTVHWAQRGEIAPPPYWVKCAGGAMEALVWFHLQRQLVDRLAPESYEVQEIISDHSSPQRWGPAELPKSNLLSKVTLSKPMAKKYADQLEAFARSGGFFTVAGS